MFSLAFGLSLWSGAMYAFSPWLVGIGVDRGILEGKPRMVILLAVLIGSLEALRCFLGYAGESLLQKVGQRVLANLRGELFSRSLWLPSAYYIKEPTGKVVTRITNDVQAMSELFSTGLAKVFVDLVLLLASLGGLLWLDARLFVLTALSLPLMVVTFRFFSKRLMDVQRGVKVCLSRINAFISENFSNLPTVRALFAHAAQIQGFERLNEAYCEAQMGQVHMNGLFQPAMRTINALSVSALLWAGGFFVLKGKMEPGVLVASLMYIQQMYRPLRDMTEKYSVLLSAFASLERIVSFGSLEKEPMSPFPRAKCNEGPLLLNYGIEFRNVSLSYDEKRNALDSVNLCIKKGERIALVGETGAGKSSMTSLMLRFFEPTDGSILWDGKDLRAIPLVRYRKAIAWVPQSICLFTGTLLENLTLFDELIAPKALALLEQAGLLAHFEAFPSGLRFRIQEGGANLSLGEKQLIGIVRSLVKDPELLVLDEATSALDPFTEGLIQRAVERLLHDKTALIVAHRLYTVQTASKIVVLKQGRVAQSGTHASLLQAGGYYASLFQAGPLGFLP
jgi:ATP-binding cassette subfamily B protein